MDRAWPLALLLLGCSGSSPPVDTDTDTGVDTGECDDPQTWYRDKDGDGWGVEDDTAVACERPGGYAANCCDCDDDDPWVHPGMPEIPGDGKDNNCNGRVDELFGGVVVFEGHSGATPARMQVIDILGDVVATLPVGRPARSFAVDEPLAGEGWVFNDGGGVHLLEPGSAAVTLFDLDSHDFGEDLPLGFYGLATSPVHEAWLVTGADRLWAVKADGSFEQLARWDCLETDGSTELCPLEVVVDRLTGEVGLYGAFGGFGTWMAEDGLQVQVPCDPDEPEYQFVSAAWRYLDGFFGLGIEVDTGAWAVFQYPPDRDRPVMVAPWPGGLFEPTALAAEEDNGDFYVTSNGGWHRTVWRLFGDGTPGTVLYDSGADEPNWYFDGIAIVWEHHPPED